MTDQSPIVFEDPRTVLKKYGLLPKRSWGQNFLVSPHAVEKIARCCVDRPGRRIVEIGAGLGTLTGALLDRGGIVVAVERDPDMCRVLQTEFAGNEKFQLAAADAARFDYSAALGTVQGVIAGNLPYQITGRILRHISTEPLTLIRAVLMMQQEVADRLMAAPGSSARGGLSVMMQLRFEIQIVQRLAPTAFFPPPKVRSAVVELIPRADTPLEGIDGRLFDRVVKAAFSARRKTLRNAFRASNFAAPGTMSAVFSSTGINPRLRAEQLSNEQFVELARRIANGKI